MSISALIWGRATWLFLHLMVYMYPQTPSETRKTQMDNLLKGVFGNIYCGICYNHAQTYIGDHPYPLNSKTSLYSWLNDFHNAVNTRLGKPVFTLQESLAFVQDHYMQTDQNFQKELTNEISRLEKQVSTLQCEHEDNNSTVMGLAIATFVLLLFVALGIIIYKAIMNKKKKRLTNNKS